MSCDNPAIRVQHLSKCYEIYHRPQDRLKQSIYPRLQRLVGREPKTYYREFWALKDVSFEVKKGETVGIIGRNGAGKSTLLQMICGTLTPTSGEVTVNGRVAALLELGAGFNSEFTGRENVYMNGLIIGLSREEIDAKYEEITDFAEIGDFVDQPVKTYSSGMFVRLAFAVQACIEPEVLIVDEALSVGDIFFQQKCAQRMRRLMERGTTIIFVSHDLSAISRLCSDAMLLVNGQVVAAGSPKRVIEQFTAVSYGQTASRTLAAGHDISRLQTDPLNIASIPLQPIPEHVFRYGDGGMRILSFALLRHDNHLLTQFESGETIKLALEIECNESGLVPNVGFQIRDRFGNIATGTNTRMLSYAMAPQDTGSSLTLTFNIQLMLGAGEYTISLAVASDDDKPERIYDWLDQLTRFVVTPATGNWVDGLAYCPVKATSSELLAL